MLSNEVQLPRLSGGGPIKFAGTKTDHKSYAAGSDYGSGGSLPFVHEKNGRARLTTRTTRSDPSLRRKRTRKDPGKNRTSNSAPTPVKGRRPSNHDRNSRPKASKSSSQLPKLPTEAHGVPTVKQTRTVPTESSKKWASSWAEVRATSLQRDEIKSPLVSPTSPSSCRTEITGKSLQTSNTSTSSSSGFVSQSEGGKKYDSRPQKVSRASPFYAKPKSEINAPKRRTNQKPKEEAIRKVQTKPPPLERSKSKIGFFNREGNFILDEDADPHEDLVRSKTVSSIRPRRSPPKRIMTSQSAKTIKEMKKPKLRRRPVVITKKTLSHEKSLQSVYGNRSFKLQRHVSFLKQLTEAQKEKMEEENKMEEERARQRTESWKRQRMELKKIRDRFDEEQVKRFGRQYVSWKSVETDRLNRKSEEYGLPDNIYDDRYDKTLKENSSKFRTNRKPKSFHQFATWMKNIKRFENLLNPKLGTNLEKQLQNQSKTIVEGIDTVELAAKGNDLTRPTKNIKVDRVIGSAKRILHSQEMDAISEVSSLEELEDNLKTIDISK
ncbi:hypothetical protein HOLleu_33854 [Holothuria leucospilota]|uniref:Uncharacterized protein n=1 Tax=Holothuria leucospilota TaxID=206669 RepID=A0A9Q0YPF8_HOLLE|nr:hypothetical protein HOLleu_33854 [Holothuria leucospilota]